VVTRFIDEHRDRQTAGLRWGVEPICAELSKHGCGIAPSTYYAAKTRPPSRRSVRDEVVLEHVRRVHASPMIGRRVYGARKVWHELAREQRRGEHLELGPVPRCQVERLMRTNGLRGVRRDKTFVTTRPDRAANRPPDLVKRNFRAEAPNVVVLVLSQYDDAAYLRQALVAGASGYALKRSSGAELVQSLRTVARGEMYLHPSLARVLVADALGSRRGDAGPAREALSEREAQVLRLVALGHTSQQIAEQLFLSVRTVETYKSRGMEKLGLRGRAELVQYALENGLLEPGEAG